MHDSGTATTSPVAVLRRNALSSEIGSRCAITCACAATLATEDALDGWTRHGSHPNRAHWPLGGIFLGLQFSPNQAAKRAVATAHQPAAASKTSWELSRQRAKLMLEKEVPARCWKRFYQGDADGLQPAGCGRKTAQFLEAMLAHAALFRRLGAN